MSDYIPQWLRDRQADHARAAQIRLCAKCAAPVLVGFDADICALTVQIDPTPISELGEAQALMQGRGTYDLIAAKGRREIWHRAEWNITTARRGPVFPAHQCHGPALDPAPPTGAPSPPTRPTAPTTGQLTLDTALEAEHDRPPY